MNHAQLIEEKLTHSVIGAFFESYNTVGFGLLEHIYVMSLERELRTRGHHVARELAVPFFYKGEELGTQRLDMVVDDKLIVEVKATQELHKSAHRQLLSYLNATRFEVGILLHYGPEAKFYRQISTNDRKENLTKKSALIRSIS